MKWLRLFLFCNVMVLSADATDNCEECSDPIVDSDDSLQLCCSHTFHLSCIRFWVNENRCCPVCKAPTGTIEEEEKRYCECKRKWERKQEQRRVWELRREYEQIQRENEQIRRENEHKLRIEEQKLKECEQLRLRLIQKWEQDAK